MKLAKPNIAVVQATIMAIAGLISAWYIPLSLFYRYQIHRHIVDHHHIVTLSDWGTVIVVMGILLMCFSYYLAQKKRVAYELSLVTLVCLVVAHLQNHTNPILVLPIIVLGFWLYYERSLYYVRSSGLRLRSGLSIGIILMISAFIFGSMTLLILSRGQLTLGQVAHDSLSIMNTSSISYVPRHHPEILERTIHIIYALEVMAFLAAFASLFRPIKFVFGNSSEHRHEAEELINKYGISSEDFLKLFPHDKNYYFNDEKSAVIAYGIIGKSVIILGGPVGKTSEKPALVKDFTSFCQENGWRVAAINIDATDLELYKNGGLANKLFVGSEAVVDAKLFSEKTIRSKHFRYITNRAQRNGLTIEFWTQPTSSQIDEIQAVSKSWSSAKGRRDYRFFMGPFYRQYMQACEIAVVRQGDKVIAYANLLPHNDQVKTSSIDHMRSIQDADSATMHFLLSQIILHEHAAGQSYFTLGLSPLESGTDDSEKVTALLRYARRVGSRFYAFGGLSQFKNKFEPNWQPQYIAFSGAASQYLSVLNDVTTIGSTNPRLRMQYRILAVIVVLLIMIIYIALP